MLTNAELRRLKPKKRLHGIVFSLSVAPLSASTRAKFACVVSKRIASRAVDRNTLKRRCRAALQPVSAQLSPAAYVFTAKREAAAASYAAVREDIQSLLGRI